MTGNLPNPSDMLDALLNLEDGLSDWEVEFIESLSQRRDRVDAYSDDDWEDRLSPKQVEKLEQLYEKHC